MADGPVFMRQTVRESSVSTGFECNGYIWRGGLYMYISLARPWEVSLGHFEIFLDTFELVSSSLSLTLCLEGAFC
jgi:hypothetical protein